MHKLMIAVSSDNSCLTSKVIKILGAIEIRQNICSL